MNHAWILHVYALVILLMCFLFQWFGKWPTVDSLHRLSNVANSRGGNIMILGGMSMVFFYTAIRFVYWVLNGVKDGRVDASNAFAMAGFTFVTGVAFGGANGAMLKSMTGESSQSRTVDRPVPPGTSRTVESKVESTTTVAAAVQPVADTQPAVSPQA